MRLPHLTFIAAMLVAAAPVEAQRVSIPEGTEVVAVTVDQLSSKTAAEGDAVSLRVENDVVVNGAVVIERGTAIRGSVSHVEGKGRMGKSGKISIRVEATTAVDGQKVLLRATRGTEGDGKVGTTVVLTVLFGPLGLLKSGKDAIIKPGTAITTYTNQALTVGAIVRATPMAVSENGAAVPVSLSGVWVAVNDGHIYSIAILQSGSNVSGSGESRQTANAGSHQFQVSGFASATDAALTFSTPSTRNYFNATRKPDGTMEGTLIGGETRPTLVFSRQ
jgi:hypothetical protein